MGEVMGDVVGLAELLGAAVVLDEVDVVVVLDAGVAAAGATSPLAHTTNTATAAHPATIAIARSQRSRKRMGTPNGRF